MLKSNVKLALPDESVRQHEMKTKKQSKTNQHLSISNLEDGCHAATCLVSSVGILLFQITGLHIALCIPMLETADF